MFKSIFFLLFVVIWSVTDVKSEASRKDFVDGFRKDNSRYWLVSCPLNDCSVAFSSCMNCYGERGCKSCISLIKPECSLCAYDIYNKDDLETINGNKYLICDSQDPIQSKVCHFYCRGKYEQSGQCVRENNLPICKCFSDFGSSTTDTTVTTQTTQSTYSTTTSQSSSSDTTVTTQTTQSTYSTTTSQTNKPTIYFNGTVKLKISVSGDYQRILPLPNGDLVRTLGNSIEIWDIQKGIIKKYLRMDFYNSWNLFNVLGIMSNGDLVSGFKFSNYNYSLLIWDLKITNGEPLKRIIQTNEYLNCLTVLKNDDLAIGQNDYPFDIIIRNSQNGMIRNKLIGHSKWVYQIIELPNGNLVSCSYDKTVKVWNILNGALIKSIAHTHPVTSIAFLQNGHIASGLDNGTINIWNLETNQLIRNLIGHSDSICYNNCLHVLSNGDLLSGSRYDTLKVWNTSDGTVKFTSMLDVRQIAVLQNGNFISSSPYELLVWN